MSDTKLQGEFPSAAVEFWSILGGRVVMKGMHHIDWSWYCLWSHMTIKSLVWPYKTPRSGVASVRGEQDQSLQMPGCSHRATLVASSHSELPFLGAASAISACPWSKGPAAPGSVRHMPPLCRASTTLSIVDIPHLQWEGLWKFLSRKCSYFICYSKWSCVTVHSLPTVPSDHMCTEVLFLFYATTNSLIPGTCKHNNKSKFQVLGFEKQSTNPLNSSTNPIAVHWYLTHS